MNRFQEKQREANKREASSTPHNGAERELKPLEDFTAYVQEYSRQHPERVALTCIGLGFILGWKLKLW
jgi:hypothetical protein